jgi:hypothetical protein
VELGGAGSGGRRWQCGRALAEPEVRDNRWAHLSAGAERGKGSMAGGVSP